MKGWLFFLCKEVLLAICKFDKRWFPGKSSSVPSSSTASEAAEMILLWVLGGRLLLKEELFRICLFREVLVSLFFNTTIVASPGYCLQTGYDTSFFSTLISNLTEVLPHNDLVHLPSISSLSNSYLYIIQVVLKLFLNYLIFFILVKSSRFLRVNYCKLAFLI